MMATTQGDAFPPLRRLLQEPLEGSDETTWAQERAIELLQSMDELQIASGRKERLLLRLGQGQPQVPASYARPSVPLRGIVIGALLMGICGGAMASVALTKWPGWMARSYQKVLFRSPQSVLSPPALPARRLGMALADSDPAPVQPSPATAPDPVPALRSPATVHRSSLEARAPRPRAETYSDDAVLLVAATRALRVEGNPARARTLARRYLELQPSGALANEALAISIEAALDHGDADAPALGARYLALFPHGSFRSLAERALASSNQRP
jgi:hypothetical protein